MPEYEVTLCYTVAWTASKIVTAQTPRQAQEIVEKDGAQIDSYASFQRWVEENSSPEIEQESFEVTDVHEV